jgi:hypothetical protein
MSNVATLYDNIDTTSVTCHNRTVYDNDDTLSVTRRNDCHRGANYQHVDDSGMNNNLKGAAINIYRYKFTEEFTSEMFTFAKIHQYDHRKDFKEAWNVWLEDNAGIVEDEVRRLTNLGFDGNILDKMFKSARYYFRKKSTNKKDPVKRRSYISLQKGFLETIDDHIKTSLQKSECKPSNGFDDFCKSEGVVDLLKEEITYLCKNGLTDVGEIKNKIKKTYKNRYFLLIHNN